MNVTLPDFTLPDFLQPDSPYRVWAIAAGICLLACLPAKTRRIGGISICAVVGAGVLFFFIKSVFEQFTPAGS